MSPFNRVPERRSVLRRLSYWAAGLAAATLMLATMAELGARHVLGLGDPPLYVTHPTIEYLSKPGDYMRFGNRVLINDYSMRSGPITPVRENPDELRVLMIGDSVINGGALTDQSELASTILERALTKRLDVPVRVANISEGGWGTPNMLAYLNEFGLFDADVVVFVLSSHDAYDVPTFGPLGKSFPQEAPVSALYEGVSRYSHRLFSRAVQKTEALAAGTTGGPALKPSAEDEQAVTDEALTALTTMIHNFRNAGAKVIVAHHATQRELDEGYDPEGGLLERTAESAGAETIALLENWKAIRDAGSDIYRDAIHINSEGQTRLAELLMQPVTHDLTDSLVARRAANVSGSVASAF